MQVYKCDRCNEEISDVETERVGTEYKGYEYCHKCFHEIEKVLNQKRM